MGHPFCLLWLFPGQGHICLCSAFLSPHEPGLVLERRLHYLIPSLFYIYCFYTLPEQEYFIFHSLLQMLLKQATFLISSPACSSSLPFQAIRSILETVSIAATPWVAPFPRQDFMVWLVLPSYQTAAESRLCSTTLPLLGTFWSCCSCQSIYSMAQSRGVTCTSLGWVLPVLSADACVHRSDQNKDLFTGSKNTRNVLSLSCVRMQHSWRGLLQREHSSFAFTLSSGEDIFGELLVAYRVSCFLMLFWSKMGCISTWVIWSSILVLCWCLANLTTEWFLADVCQ